ncbi:MAG: UDP-N-acetylmuramate--L-alanine ligase [Planctomycetaceae bacterium]|nr:UDP-N-acetylmuramate--L-alanine ligase [Planctomycetaceae bacterium]
MKIHFIGIGGIGMSGIAKIAVVRGDSVSGSDQSPCDFPGAAVGHAAENIPKGVSLVVRSAAIKDDNVEVVAAKKRNIPVIKYAEMLGRLTREKATIAVSGCHGKTTTTSMISYVLSRAGFEPSYVCGGVISQLGSNAAPGAGKHLVVEACEYDRSFLNLSPACAVITNIEEDHLDYYKDIAEIIGAFRDFAAKSSGPVIGSLDNAHCARLLGELKGKGESFSIEKDADWRARNIEVFDGRWSFDLLKYGRPYGRYTLGVAGEHNVSNALAAVAACTWAGVGQEILQVALAEFNGAARRFQKLGEKNGALVIDDYGHHPTEIQATLKAAKERYPDRKIWCVFQPHQTSRTKIFFKDFARSFADASVVLLPEIYEARGKGDQKVSSKDLAQAISENGKAALFMPTFDDVVAFLKEKATPDCLILTMGAGNVDQIARRFLAE